MIGQTVCSGIPLVRNIGRKWEMSSESVRAGLSLNCSTGEISGIATRAASSFTYSITARNAAGSTSVEISIEIIPEYLFFPQTSLIIGEGLSFSLTPHLREELLCLCSQDLCLLVSLLMLQLESFLELQQRRFLPSL